MSVLKKNKMIKERTKINNRFGVIPIPIYLPPMQSCDLNCLYCPNSRDLPRSYIENQDTIRARRLNFEPDKQLRYWMKKISQTLKNENFYKLEIILLGGTFSNFDKAFLEEFFKKLYNTLNNKCSVSLDKAKEKNRYAKYRAVIISIETRPDCINQEELKFFKNLGISKIELGVQSIFSEILEKNGRPYSKDTIINATKLIKDFGFKIGYHIMLNLPFSNIEMDRAMLKEIIFNENFVPDYIKIYPTTLIKRRKYQPRLWRLFEENIWKPYTKDELYSLLIELKKYIPEYIRIQRIGRQFDNLNFIYSNNLRLEIQAILQKSGFSCRCIRCQEINVLTNNDKIDYSKIEINTLKYSNQDIYIYAKSNNLLLGYAKVRIKSNKKSAILRELKITGHMTSKKLEDKNIWQNKGIGQRMVLKIENIMKSYGIKRFFVNTSPGVENFYIDKLNYKKTDLFLMKNLG